MKHRRDQKLNVSNPHAFSNDKFRHSDMESDNRFFFCVAHFYVYSFLPIDFSHKTL